MNSKNRIHVLIMGVIEFACLGLMYSWSKFSLAIRTDLLLNQAQATAAYSLCMGFFTIGILSDGFIGKKVNSKVMVLVGVILTAIGYFLTTLLDANTRFVIYITYGLFVGYGIGFVYNEWLNNVLQHFKDKSGFAVGMILLGMGMSGITTTPIMAKIATIFGWRLSFRLIALCILIVGTISVFFIEQVDEIKENRNNETNYSTPKQMVLSSAFWLFALWKLLMIGTGQSYSGQVANIIYDIGCNDSLQLLSVSVFVLCNGFSRLLWGIILDKIGNRRLMYFTTILLFVSLIGLKVAMTNGIVSLCIISMSLIGLTYGGTSIIGTNYISSVFGKKYYKTNNGISAVSALPGSVGMTYVTGFIREKYGNFIPFVNINIPVCVFCFVLIILINNKLAKSKEGNNGC